MRECACVRGVREMVGSSYFLLTCMPFEGILRNSGSSPTHDSYESCVPGFGIESGFRERFRNNLKVQLQSALYCKATQASLK